MGSRKCWWLVPLLCTAQAAAGGPALAARPLVRIEVSFPGPRNLSYLPLDLVPRLGTDREEGAQVVIRHASGGSVALHNLARHRVGFAICGMPAVLSEAASGGDVVAIAAVNDAPLRVLMVRSELRGQVKRISDLRGRAIGVPASSLTSKTASQQLLEMLLRADGVRPDEVRFITAGQSWEEQSSVLAAGTVDALMGDEPFASRLLAEGKVFLLVNLAEPGPHRSVPGIGYLHAALITRRDVVAQSPETVAKMVSILKKTLGWIAKHTPEDLVDRLGVEDPVERASLRRALKRYPNLYSKDGHFSSSQLEQTQLFFRSGFPENPSVQRLDVNSIVLDQWVGRSD